MLWEMRIDKGRKKRPAGVLCSIDSDSVDASLLVEERFVHVLERKWSVRCRDSATRYDQMPPISASNHKSNAGIRQKTKE